MNLEFTNDIPKHFNTPFSGKRVYWTWSDRKESWLNNVKTNQQFFEENGWLDEFAIEYNYNSHGFRSQEFNNNPSWIALGCSFTEGTGLPIDAVWVSLLSNLMKIHIWNLGVASGALDTCFRLLEYYIDKLNIQGVFLLQPPAHRFELFSEGYPCLYLPNDRDNAAFPIFKNWVGDDNNIKFNEKKNLLAMQKLCDINNIRLIKRTSNDLLNNGTSVRQARDLAHPGKDNHINLANIFYKDYING
jgi:hypothetical protein